jgi:hypothetical protein
MIIMMDLSRVFGCRGETNAKAADWIGASGDSAWYPLQTGGVNVWVMFLPILFNLVLSLHSCRHHTFYFEEDLDTHLRNVFAWSPPNGTYAPQPTFYVSATSKTQPDVAPPAGGETIFVLVPIHYQLNGSDTVRAVLSASMQPSRVCRV